MAEPVLETIDSALSALSHASESIPSRVLRDSEAMVCHSGTVRAKQRASPYPTERTTAMLVSVIASRIGIVLRIREGRNRQRADGREYRGPA